MQHDAALRADAETDQLREQLLQRVPVDLRASDDFVMEQQRGYAVIKTGSRRQSIRPSAGDS